MHEDRITYEHIGQYDGSPGYAPLDVDVVMVVSRGMANPWVMQAAASVRACGYPSLGLLTVVNGDHELTIGKAWNLAVRASSADAVLFLGDDDYIAPDLVFSLVEFMRAHQAANPELVMVTGPCTAVDEQNRPLMQIPVHHTGMFDRDWLLEHPFNEARQRFVDTEMHDRLGALTRLRGKPLMAAMSYHYGYFYRQHVGMVSGQKVARQPAAMPQGMRIHT